MDYDEEGGNKKVFSGNTITIVAGVIALIIFSAIVSVYPHGMEISEIHDVVYSGNKDIGMSGKIGIKGNIDGIVASNVSGEFFSGAGEIIVRNGSSVKTFLNRDFLVTGGDSELNLTSHINEEFGCAVILFNTSGDAPLEMAADGLINLSCTGDATLIIKNGSVSVGNGTWEGNGDFLITIKGGFHASLDAKIFGISAEGPMKISVSKGGSFDDTILDGIDIKLPPLPFSLNGFFAVSDGVLSVDGNPVTIKNFSFFRGDGTAVLEEKSIRIDMRAVLAVIDGDFYSTERGTILWFIPDGIISLWPIAIAVWAITTLLKRKYISKVEDYDRGLSGLSVVIHVLAFAVSFYLWDRETEYMFGQSILSAAVKSLSSGFSILDWMVAPFEVIPWLAAMVFISLPVGIILSSLFGLMGLERLGKGVGRAAGLLLLFFAGFMYVSFFLNITLSPLIRGFMGF